LYAHAAGLVEHHGDIARSHERLLFDLLLIENFDVQRLILDPHVRAGRRDGDFFFLDEFSFKFNIEPSRAAG